MEAKLFTTRESQNAPLTKTARNIKEPKKKWAFYWLTHQNEEILGLANDTTKSRTVFRIYKVGHDGIPRPTGARVFAAMRNAERALRWGKGVLGPERTTYPHPQNWTFAELIKPKQLDLINVNSLTAAFRSRISINPTCLTSWPKRFECNFSWDVVARNYKIGLMTNRDYASHFKCILHARFKLRSHCPVDGNTHCRLGCAVEERLMHWFHCPLINPLWDRFIRLINVDEVITKSPQLIYLAVDKSSAIRPIFNALHKMLWKFIIIALAGVNDGEKFNQEHIWGAAIRRLLVRMRTITFGAHTKLMKWKGRVDEIPDELINKLLGPARAKLNPLGELTDSAELKLNESLRNELISAGLDGKLLEKAIE